MPIIAFGLNHRHAGIDLRGRASILPEDLKNSLPLLVNSAEYISEALVLSTCNRTELHCIVQQEDEQIVEEHLRRWLAEHRNITLSELVDKTYFFSTSEATRHIMRVAAGLDSQVLGEPQIFGQYKAAYQAAVKTGTIGPELEPIVTAVVRTCKRIRNETEIGRHCTSLPQAAVLKTQQEFPNLSSIRVLLIGAGQIIRAVSKYLHTAGVRAITVANRTLANAVRIAQDVDGKVIPLTEYGEHLYEFDVLITSTNSDRPIVSFEVVKNACEQRRDKPMLIADLAVPRDVDPFVRNLEQVRVFTVDELSSDIQTNLSSRHESVHQAEQIIEEGLENLNDSFRAREVSTTVSKYRSNMEDIRDQEIDFAVTRLRAGEDPQQVIANLAQSLTQKLVHFPTVALRNASIAEDVELLNRLCTAYEIES